MFIGWISTVFQNKTSIMLTCWTVWIQIVHDWSLSLLFVQDGFPLMTLFNKSLVGSVLVWNRIYRKKVNNLLKHFSLIGCLKCELWWPNTECCQMLVDCKMKERTTSWCSLIRQHVDHFWHLLRKWVGLESQNKSGPIFFANDHCVKIS